MSGVQLCVFDMVGPRAFHTEFARRGWKAVSDPGVGVPRQCIRRSTKREHGDISSSSESSWSAITVRRSGQG